MILEMALLAFMATGLPVQAQQDTTLPVERGTRLEADIFRGELRVRTWNRDAVRIEARSSDRRGGTPIRIGRSGSVLRLRAEPEWSGHRQVDAVVTMPGWMAVEVEGNQLDVEVEAGEGAVSVETVNGDVVVRGGSGYVRLATVSGDIEARDLRGQVWIAGVNGGIALTGVVGDIEVETVNGGIRLVDVESASVSASTVNGGVLYEGTVRDDGRYRLASHNGSVVMSVPQRANASVAVSTYSGSFEADFPIQLTGMTSGKQLDFTLGNGSARIELESFNGTVRIRRPRNR